MDTVYADNGVTLRENALFGLGKVIESANTQVNEIWIFQHQPDSDDPTWYLAGIQQS